MFSRGVHNTPCTNEDSRSLGNLLREDDGMDIHVCCLYIAPISRILGNGLGLPISGTWSASSISKAARPCSLGSLHRQLTCRQHYGLNARALKKIKCSYSELRRISLQHGETAPARSRTRCFLLRRRSGHKQARRAEGGGASHSAN